MQLRDPARGSTFSVQVGCAVMAPACAFVVVGSECMLCLILLIFRYIRPQRGPQVGCLVGIVLCALSM